MALLTETPSGNLDDDSPQNAAAMVEDLGLRVTQNLFENWAGHGERWIWGQGGWLFITPDGMLYEFDENAGVDGQIPGVAVAELGTESFRDPVRFISENRRRR